MAEQMRPPLVTESLLQELLLALLGFFGDVFMDSGSAENWDHVPDPALCTVRLADYVDWVDPPDRHAARPSEGFMHQTCLSSSSAFAALDSQ